MSRIETIEYKNINIDIFYDDNCYLDDILYDFPIAVIAFSMYHDHNFFDKTKKSLPNNHPTISAIEQENVFGLVYELGTYEIYKTEKSIVIDFFDGEPKKYFKTEKSAFDAVMKYEGWDDLKLHQVTTLDNQVYVMWFQDELDKYAGVKNATPPTHAVQCYFDGEMYGYVIENDGHDDSCWGFVGTVDYCVQCAKDEIDAQLRYNEKKRQQKLKTFIKNRVPLNIRLELAQ